MLNNKGFEQLDNLNLETKRIFKIQILKNIQV